MHSQTTTKSAYRCDTDLLTAEVLEAREQLFARTARYPCAVRLNPLDRHFLMTAPIGMYGPAYVAWANGAHDYLCSLAVLLDETMQPGIARVEICDGCCSMWRNCEYGVRRSGDPEGAARLVVDALADLGDEWARPQRDQDARRPPADSPVPLRAERLAPQRASAKKRTRKPSRQELERRAQTADRKAAEAAAKAERARKALEDHDG